MLSVDPLHLAIALFPLSLYLLELGFMNFSRRPKLVTGARDTLALGLSVSGLLAAGPMELFMPEAAAQRFHGFIWALLFAFYFLCLTLVVLLMRPRLIIYNVSIDQLRPLLAGVVADLDRDARWAGDSLVLPSLDVQLHIEQSGLLRNAQLVSSGPRQNFAGWRRLELALREELRQSTAPRNRQALFVLLGGVALAAIACLTVTRNPHQVAALLKEFLRN